MYNSVLMSLDMEGLNIIYGCGAGLLSSSLRFLEAGGLSLESSWLLATVVVLGLSAELERSGRLIGAISCPVGVDGGNRNAPGNCGEGMAAANIGG